MPPLHIIPILDIIPILRKSMPPVHIIPIHNISPTLKKSKTSDKKNSLLKKS